MKRIHHYLLLVFFFPIISSAQHFKLKQIIPTGQGEIGHSMNKWFDVFGPHLTILNQNTLTRIYLEDTTNVTLSTTTLPQLSGGELYLDIALLSPTQTLLLTNKRCMLIPTDTTGKLNGSLKTTYKQKHQTYTHILKTNNPNEYQLSVNFTGSPELTPKINICDIVNENHVPRYQYHVKCDPFYFETYKKLIASDGNGLYAMQRNNLENMVFILNKNFDPIDSFALFPEYTFDENLLTKACEAYQNYRAFGDYERFDELEKLTDQIPEMDQMQFLNDTTLLVLRFAGVPPDRIMSYQEIIYLNQTKKRVSVKNPPKPYNKDTPFTKDLVHFDPVTKACRAQNNRVYYRYRYFAPEQYKTMGAYQEAMINALKTGSNSDYAIYVFELVD